jgi:hypothetical protein
MGLTPQSVLGTLQRSNNFSNPSPDLQQASQRLSGIVLDFTDMLMYQLPTALAVTLVGLTLFKMTENKRISVIFKQFSFAGYSFAMVLEGNI